MRDGSVRLLDGQADLTDAMLASLQGPHTGEAEAFLIAVLGYTKSAVKDLLGSAYIDPPAAL